MPPTAEAAFYFNPQNMKHLIKLVAVTKKEKFAIHEWAGRQFIFLWNEALSAYTYEPKNQAESDLIFSTPRQSCAWTFASHYIKEPGDAASVEETAAAIAAKDAEIASLKAERDALQENLDGAEKMVLDMRKQLSAALKKPKGRAAQTEQPAPAALEDTSPPTVEDV
jgi:hypothetical protein